MDKDPFRSLPSRPADRRSATRRLTAALLALALAPLADGCAVRDAPADVPASRTEGERADVVEATGEPVPSAEAIERAARVAAGLEPDSTGAIPPPERFFSETYDPPSRPPLVDAPGDNVRVNQDVSGRDQNETVITVNPNDPLNLVGGANDYRTGSVKCGYYASFDGGATWVDGVLPEETYPLQGDPTAAFCADGSVVYVCLSFTGSFQPHGLFAYVSDDGGVTWSDPEPVVDRPNGFPFADKEWVACDTTANGTANNIYVTWTDFGFQATPILLSRSTNGGRTFSGSVRVSDGGSTQGSVIAVGPDGAVNVAWADSSAGSRIGFDRSVDGGQTFGVDVFPSAVDGIPGDPVFRRNSFPTMDADRGAGPHSGNLYIAWSDDRNGDPDILMVRSVDGGASWSEPIRVNDDAVGNGADQFFPWLAVDADGRVIVTFMDRRRSPGERPYEIWGAISRDGGRTFDTNFLISNVASDGSLNGFIGDYTGLAASSEAFHPMWTDLRAGTGETDAYTDRIESRFDYDEVDDVRFTDPDSIAFEDQDARFGEDLTYDVLSGFVSELRSDGGYHRTTCAADAWPGSPYTDTRVPPVDDGLYFLIRAAGPSGVGTYGDGTAARPNVRDVLDEGTAICP